MLHLPTSSWIVIACIFVFFLTFFFRNESDLSLHKFGLDDVNLNKKFKLSGKMKKKILPNDPNGTKDMLGEGSSESLLSWKLIACMVEYI